MTRCIGADRAGRQSTLCSDGSSSFHWSVTRPIVWAILDLHYSRPGEGLRSSWARSRVRRKIGTLWDYLVRRLSFLRLLQDVRFLIVWQDSDVSNIVFVLAQIGSGKFTTKISLLHRISLLRNIMYYGCDQATSRRVMRFWLLREGLSVFSERFYCHIACNIEGTKGLDA